MKIQNLILSFILILCFSVNGHAAGKFSIQGYDIYLFGIDIKDLEDSNYLAVAGGAAASLVVHTAGHWAYAWSQSLSVRQNGLTEQLGSSDPMHVRRFCQAGFLFQNLVGLVLTSLPQTRYGDFTKGYVAAAYFEINSYPAVWSGSDYGDLKVSGLNGGNEWGEYAAYLSIASYNYLRTRKMSLEDALYGRPKNDDVIRMTTWDVPGNSGTLSKREPLPSF